MRGAEKRQNEPPIPGGSREEAAERGAYFLILAPLATVPQKCVAFLWEPYSGEQGGIVKKHGTIPQSLRDSSLYTREPWIGGLPLALISCPPCAREGAERSEAGGL